MRAASWRNARAGWKRYSVRSRSDSRRCRLIGPLGQQAAEVVHDVDQADTDMGASEARAAQSFAVAKLVDARTDLRACLVGCLLAFRQGPVALRLVHRTVLEIEVLAASRHRGRTIGRVRVYGLPLAGDVEQRLAALRVVDRSGAGRKGPNEAVFDIRVDMILVAEVAAPMLLRPVRIGIPMGRLHRREVRLAFP